MQHLPALQELTSLTELSGPAIEWLATHVRPAVFQPGDRLIVEGERTRECYFIIEGSTEVRRGGAVLGVSGPGEPEGELGLFLRSPRSATTTALTTVSTLVLAAEDWDGLCVTNPALADEIRTAVCRHLAERFGLQSFAGVARRP